MNVSTITNSMISTLGNPDSRIPLAIKDIINSSGITYYSYDAGGKFEGKDRFIDEFGTEAIWLGGLPFFKWIADKTIYKFRKLDPKIDVRVVNDEDHCEFAKKILSSSAYETERKIEETIDTAKKRLPEFKNLFYSKFTLATILTFASYYALTKYKQKTTEKAITKEFINKQINNEYFIRKSQESDNFKSFNNIAFSGINKNKKTDAPSFKGKLESFMFNPVKNMLIIDAGITSERLLKSRNKHEFTEYAIKEGSLLFLLYIAGKWIQSGLEGFSEKVMKTPIDLDLRFLNSAILKNNINSDTLKNEIKEFNQLKTPKEILDYIFKHKNEKLSVIMNGAKLSGIIAQFKNTENIDPRKYIDTEELKSMVSSLEKLVNAAKEEKNPLKFLTRARNNKIGSVVANMAICCTALGFVVPKIMFNYRKQNEGTTQFHVEREIQERLAQTFSSNTI